MCCKIQIVVVVVVILSVSKLCECWTKTWTKSSDILDAQNWVNDGDKNCNGLLFTENFIADVYLDSLEINRIVFPREMDLIVVPEDVKISFVPKSKCIKVKALSSRYWDYKENWSFEGDDNAAIPDIEKAACEFDVIKFPKGGKSSIFKSNELIAAEELYSRTGVSVVNSLPFSPRTTYVMRVLEPCSDPSGCLCRNNANSYLNLRCTSFQEEMHIGTLKAKEPKVSCLDPINPIGFCDSICGAQILFEAKPNFEIKKIQDLLADYSNIDTHASKVFEDDNVVIQVILTEKQFTGKSLDYAEDIFDLLRKDDSYKTSKLRLVQSGPFYEPGKISRNAFGLIFGTLAAVLVVFAAIFVMFGKADLTTRPLSSYRPYFFAKYDSQYGSTLVLGDQLLSGSVVSLDRAFDNPLYEGQSSSNDNFDDIRPLKTENPLYEIKEAKEDGVEELIGLD